MRKKVYKKKLFLKGESKYTSCKHWKDLIFHAPPPKLFKDHLFSKLVESRPNRTQAHSEFRYMTHNYQLCDLYV